MEKNGNPWCLLILLLFTLESGLQSICYQYSRLWNVKSSFSSSIEFCFNLVTVFLITLFNYVINGSDLCTESRDNIFLAITMPMSSVRVHVSRYRLFVVLLKLEIQYVTIINYYHHHYYHYLSYY